MATRSAKQPLQAEKPKVIVLGDCVVDCHVYDNRAEDADQWLAWTSPLSRDDWHYAAGFDMHQCLAGAAAIQAMLWTNGIDVAGNAFPIDRAFLKPQETGSVFVLRRRANAGKTKEERTRAYLKSDNRAWRDVAASSDKKAADNRGETWRAAASFLSKSGKPYVEAFDPAKHKHPNENVKAVCFLDLGRGFFHPRKHDRWKDQQDMLFKWYKELCTDAGKPAVLIRTSDPDNFARLLTEFASDPDGAPTVVLVCGQAQIYDGDLRGSGTWSGVWQQTYDYLNKSERGYLYAAKGDWRFNVVIPVYEDGVIWIGPGCWPIDEADRKAEFLRQDTRPIGKLFLVPGTQPGLSEFEEHSRIIGVHALLTYSILEQLAETPGNSDVARAIKEGLMRCRRLRGHGYCGPGELVPVDDPNRTFYVNYPREIWRKGQREATDLLLQVTDTEAVQNAGPYEVRCRVKFPCDTDATSPALLRIFRTMEKQISDDFVGSPRNCYRVVGDVGQDKDALERFGCKEQDGWIKINGEPCPLDSFAREEIASFRLRQRISMQFGNFAMADPKEAALMLDLAQRVRQHVLSNRYNSPEKGSVFNFALFGSPGSGKSFLAREIARLIDPQRGIFNVDEFNLSQFTEEEQLTRALEVIASKSVGGKVPLVLWDEFDSVLNEQRGGWLARFLMPMQDAHFFDGRQRRPLGTAVFVFIGGTFPNAEEFRRWACRTAKPDEPPAEAVLLKARDFHSRLYTALNMPSIIEEEGDPDTRLRHQIFTTDWENSYAKLARAVLLRQFFRNNSKIGETVFLKKVEDDLCKFLLAIPLRHGARSLQRIVEACLVSKPARVSMAHLPPKHFLAEHIETENVRRHGRTETEMTIEAMLDACR